MIDGGARSAAVTALRDCKLSSCAGGFRADPELYRPPRASDAAAWVPKADTVQPSSDNIPFSANSFFAFSFLERLVRPIPRSTLRVLVYWMFS
jgi:hypothetical protein